jgi:hypothetical protein
MTHVVHPRGSRHLRTFSERSALVSRRCRSWCRAGAGLGRWVDRKTGRGPVRELFACFDPENRRELDLGLQGLSVSREQSVMSQRMKI